MASDFFQGDFFGGASVGGGGPGPGTAEWGSAVYSKDFSTLANQDLTVTPTFDTHWTAGHTSAAAPFNITNGSGIVCKPNNGTNWTGSGSWTAPYVSAVVADLLGFTPDVHDWLAFILQVSVDSEATGGTVTDIQLNYGTSHAGLQSYRNETRSVIAGSYGGSGHVRTYAGSQSSFAGPPNAASFQNILEAQIRGGIWYSARDRNAFPSEPSVLTTPSTPDKHTSVEDNDPSTVEVYDPSTDVVALSAYNAAGGTKTITFERLDIYHIDMSGVI
jgi:hypothetical protein